MPLDLTTRQAAERIHDRYRADVDRVRTDQRYVDTVKHARIARAYLDAKAELDALREQHDTKTTSRRTTLQRQLFGVGNTVVDVTSASVSLRDATDRVDRLRAGDAKALRALLDRALLQGDTYLAKACFARAWADGDNDAVNAYLEGHPQHTPAAQELLDLGDGTEDLTSASFIDGMVFEITQPTEIRGTTDTALAELANSELARA